MYQAAIFNKDLERLLKLFSSIVKEPLLLPEEVQHVCESSLFELDEHEYNMDELMPALLHSTAYTSVDGSTNTFGNPLLAPREVLSSPSVDALREHRETWYSPDRIVIAGVGMPHDQLTELVEKYFGDMPVTSPETFKTQLQKSRDIQYSGGIKVIDSKNLPSPNPDDYPFTHVHVGFESFCMNDPDVYAIATLASLLGGGGSFSAGGLRSTKTLGPGKGMYTRLYMDVLNRYHWIESANKIHHSYFDTGLFGISVSVPPIKDAHEAILPIICDQLVQATQNISALDLKRAKNQLKSNLLMSLESKLVTLEDLGRQILFRGKAMSSRAVEQRIDSLAAEDLKRAVRRVVFGSNERSPLGFEDCKEWKRTGDGSATVVVRGHLFRNDPLLKVDRVLSEWGVGSPVKTAKAAKSWF